MLLLDNDEIRMSSDEVMTNPKKSRAQTASGDLRVKQRAFLVQMAALWRDAIG
jgi:hypothetical protein